MKAIVFRFVVAMVGMAALLTIGGSPAAAQGLALRGSAAMPPARSETVCDMHAAKAPSYLDCALWFDRGRLRRGSQGDVVGVEGLGPLPLHLMVVGDSAKRHAFQYEQDRWIAEPFLYGGQIALLTSWILERRRCKTVGCSNAGSYSTAKVWFITGMSIGFVSVPFLSASRKEGNLATWWHNAQLSTLGR